MESICSVNAKKSKINFSFNFYKIIILKWNIFSQEDLKIEATIQLINKIDPVKHVSHKIEYTFTKGYGGGWDKLIGFQVINLHFLDLQTKDLNLIFNLFLKDLFDKGFIDEISDSIDVSVYIKKKV